MSDTVATAPTTTNSLVLISAARQALAEAKSLSDMRAIRDAAEAYRAYAKAHDMGVEAENSAAEIRVRAERMMGAELIRMRAAGEMARQGDGTAYRATDGNQYGVRPRISSPDPTRCALTMAEVGVDKDESFRWQKLARLDEPTFEATVQRAYDEGRRLARIDFNRVAEEILGPDEDEPEKPARAEKRTPDPGPAWTRDWAAACTALAALNDHLDHGWPLAGDRTHEEWIEVDDQLTAAGRSLLRFQQRVREYLGGADEATG